MRSSDNHLMASSQEIPQPSIINSAFKLSVITLPNYQRNKQPDTRIILWMGPANERQPNVVKLSHCLGEFTKWSLLTLQMHKYRLCYHSLFTHIWANSNPGETTIPYNHNGVCFPEVFAEATTPVPGRVVKSQQFIWRSGTRRLNLHGCLILKSVAATSLKR